MGQINSKLRSVAGSHFSHWCPGCSEMHVIPKSWTFDDNLDSPTISPSIRITGKDIVKNERGEWTGEWVRDEASNAIDFCCHYFLRSGMIEFCGDSTRTLAGKTIPLPDLPVHLTDGLSS